MHGHAPQHSRRAPGARRDARRRRRVRPPRPLARAVPAGRRRRWSVPGTTRRSSPCPAAEVLLCTDVLVDGRHFRRDWATATDIGHRAAAQSLSDVNAMGGRATAVTVGPGGPRRPRRRLGARAVRRHRGGVRARSAPRWSAGTSPARHPGDLDDRARLRLRPGGTPLGRTTGRRRRDVRAAGLGGRGPGRARSRLPLAAGAGGGLPPARGALRRRCRGAGPGRHRDDRRLRRPARRRRARGRRERGGRSTCAATRSRSTSRCRPWRLPWAPTRSASSSPAATTTPSWPPSRRSRPARPLDRRRHRHRALRAGPAVTVDGAAYDGETGFRHF